MKKVIFNFSVLAVIAIFFAACTKTDAPIKGDLLQTSEVGSMSNTGAKSSPADAINFTAPSAFPEGVVYDQFNDRFLVSSISMGTIGAVTRDGIYSPFIQDADLVSTAGMKIDKANKRLLVTNAKVDGSVAQLVIYDLNTGSRLYLVDFIAVANDGYPHLANDVALDQQGNAYVTDSYSGIIYKVSRNGNATIFYQNHNYTPAPGNFGFNGIEYSNTNQGYLLVAHSALNQVIKIPVNNPSTLTTVQLSPSIVSPDGLLLSKDNKQLIIVNNTTSNPGSKVMTFESNDNWATAISTGEMSTGVVYPTTVTSDGKTEYVLYSYIHFLFGGIQKETFTLQPLPFNDNHPF